MRRWGIAVTMLISGSSSVLAQGSWADRLVDTTKLDFGVIATGSEALKVVTIENTTNSTVQIAGFSTACRCAEASQPDGQPKLTLQPGEKTTIEIRMNTRAYKQQRDTSLTIQFIAPQFAEVRIPIRAYIRTDVVFEPGKVEFGKVEFLAGKELPVRIAYAGRRDWKIVDVKVSHQALSGSWKETERTINAQGGGVVGYELIVKLSPEARPGRIRDIVTLVTDDAANPRVPLMVEAEIVPDISISNPNVAIRALKPGETTTVKLVVQGKKPFLVEDVDCKDLQNCFEIKMSEKENKVQIVELAFTAPNTPGKFTQQMVVKVKIDDREDLIPFTVSGIITN